MYYVYTLYTYIPVALLVSLQGLYPDSHGIVDNNFYDKVLVEQYKISDNDPKWWLGEPVSAYMYMYPLHVHTCIYVCLNGFLPYVVLRRCG